MLDNLPARAFFQFEFPLHRVERPPAMNGHVDKWPLKHLLPTLMQIEDQEPFGDVYAGWDDDCLFFAFDVPDRPGKLQCDPDHWWKKDGLRICVDTRDTRDVKRGTRFCHLFYVLPTGGGQSGHAPVVGLHRMSRSTEHPPKIDVSRIKVAVHPTKNRYGVEVAIPGECLHGWAPAEHPRIGVFYKIKDTHFGIQNLSVTDDFGWNADPSAWAAAVLTP